MKLKVFLNGVHTSRTGVAMIVIMGEVVIGLLIFHAGIAYGERHVFHRMSEAYHGPIPEFGFLTHNFIPQGHGAVGVITAITLPTFSVQTRDGEVETVTVASSTMVRGFNPNMTITDLRVGQHVTILGEPENNSEQFTARFIHIILPI